MRVTVAGLAREASLQDGVMQMRDFGMDTFRASAPPVKLDVVLCLLVELHRVELGVAHPSSLRILDQDGTEIGKANFSFINHPVANAPKGWLIKSFQQARLGDVIFPNFGLYSIEVMIHEMHMASVPFQIVAET